MFQQLFSSKLKDFTVAKKFGLCRESLFRAVLALISSYLGNLATFISFVTIL